MKLLDTNIILYAEGKEHPYKKHCVSIIKDIGAGRTDLNIDVETLQEILHVYSSRNERERAILTLEKLFILFPNPISITKREVERTKELMRSYPELSARDAVHAAVVITHQLEGIVSTDKVFDKLSEIKRIDPSYR